MNNSLAYDRLQAPPDDGGLLIDPPLRDWPAWLAEGSRRVRAMRHTLAGVPVAEVRRATRIALGLPDDATVLACGHQPAFVHPGVWAKQVAVLAAAEQAAATPLDLVVDHHPPTDLRLVVPSVDAAHIVRPATISFGPAAPGCAYEFRPPADLTTLDAIAARIAAPDMRSSPDTAISGYLEGCRSVIKPLEGGTPDEPYVEPGIDFVAQHLAGRRAVDEQLGAGLPQVRVSTAFGGPFAADLLLNAADFAAVYNRCLHDYRVREHVRSPDRPLPDLRLDPDRIEAALWIYRPGEPRRRLYVTTTQRTIALYADRAPVGTLDIADLRDDPDAALRRLRPWVIRPRALTLTLWARMLICDLFVHGIGGAKYDRITDAIFRHYYRCEPPPYACVSATLRLPLPRHAVTAADLADARRQLRDVRYNPQRYLPQPPPELLARRAELIARSDQLRAQHGPRSERREVFHAIHEINAALLASAPDTLDTPRRAKHVSERLRRGGESRDAVDRLANRLSTTQTQIASNHAAADREYFYALHPWTHLQDLANRIRRA